MLDVHVLIHPDTRADWVAQCLESVESATANAGYPVAVHPVRVDADGHIGRSRASAYALGSHPYVTNVDDDDWIEPDAFAVLADALQTDAPAIYTRAWTWQNGKRCTSDLRQFLRVFRRDVTASMDFGPWPICDSTALIAHADTIGAAIDLPSRAYNYRLHSSHARRLHAYNLPALLRARALGDVHAPRAKVAA